MAFGAWNVGTGEGSRYTDVWNNGILTPGGGGVLTHKIGYIGMCGAKKRVWFFSRFGFK